MKNEYLIVDGNNLVRRAHAAFLDLKTSTGLYSSMYYNSMRMFQALRKRYRGSKMIVVWDGKPVSKKKILPAYKWGRQRLRPEIWEQVPDIKASLTALGVRHAEKLDEEADDIIATIAKKYEGPDNLIYIYTNDKDMMQLVRNGKVIVNKPSLTNSIGDMYDEEAVYKLFGVKPEKLALFMSFDGDDIDGIPRVRNVFNKSLVYIANTFNTIDEVYQNIDKLKIREKDREPLRQHEQQVRINYQLTCLNPNIENISWTEPKFDKDVLVRLFIKYEIKSISIDALFDLFSVELNRKFTDPEQAVTMEFFSLFE